MNKIGVVITLRRDTDFAAKIREAKEMGITSCQLSVWDTSLYTEERASELRTAALAEDFEISALWAGWSGPCEWNFSYGPTTIGLVPAAYRSARLAELLRGSEFAAWLGVRDIITHVGFLPSDPTDQSYVGTVGVLRHLMKNIRPRGQRFLFETGQETPVTLLRAIEDIGGDDVGINLDTANLILYGMGNPNDALEVFGKYVMNTHIKDGLYPTDGRRLGREVKAGEGRANIPSVLARLAELGYEGPYTIEREISGEEQKRDIISTVAYLREISENIAKK